MADLVQNAALVVNNNVPNRQYTAGETINAGNCCYLNGGGGDGKVYNAKASGNAAQAGLYGIFIALNTAYASQPVQCANQRDTGTITLGASGTNGQIYCVSYNAGAVAPATDLNNACLTTLLGVIVNNNQLIPGFLFSNATHP